MLKQLLKTTWVKRALTIALLWLTISLLMVFAGHPAAVERYYSQGIYPAICYVLHPVLNIFPFSVGDVVYSVVVVYLIYAVIKLIRLAFKKRFKDAGVF